MGYKGLRILLFLILCFGCIQRKYEEQDQDINELILSKIFTLKKDDRKPVIVRIWISDDSIKLGSQNYICSDSMLNDLSKVVYRRVNDEFVRDSLFTFSVLYSEKMLDDDIPYVINALDSIYYEI